MLLNQPTWSGLLLADGGVLPAMHAARQTFSNRIAWLKQTTGHAILGVDVASLLGKTQLAEPMPVIAVVKHECCKAAMDTAGGAMDTAGGTSEVYLSAVPLDIRIR